MWNKLLNLKKFLISLTWFLTISSSVAASHIIGAEISYQYVSGTQYLVTAKLYRDCSGILSPATIDVCYQSASCGTNGFASLMLMPGSFEIPQSPYFPPVMTSCQGGSGFGVELNIYQGFLTLPQLCSDWLISYTGPGNNSWPVPFPGFLITTQINNLSSAPNSSSFFTTIPIFAYCAGQPAYENLTAMDSDGDSLAYELIPTMADSHICPSNPITPLPGSMLFEPLSSTPWYIHPTDGWVNFTPSMVQVGFITVKVKEYRNGILINETLLGHQVNSAGGCGSTGIPGYVDPEVELYPNPAHDMVYVEFTQPYSVSISNMQGVIINTGTPLRNLKAPLGIDVSKLNPGMYLLQLIGETQVHTKTFVKY